MVVVAAVVVDSEVASVVVETVEDLEAVAVIVGEEVVSEAVVVMEIVMVVAQ